MGECFTSEFTMCVNQLKWQTERKSKIQTILILYYMCVVPELILLNLQNGNGFFCALSFLTFLFAGSAFVGCSIEHEWGGLQSLNGANPHVALLRA